MLGCWSTDHTLNNKALDLSGADKVRPECRPAHSGGLGRTLMHAVHAAKGLLHVNIIIDKNSLLVSLIMCCFPSPMFLKLCSRFALQQGQACRQFAKQLISRNGGTVSLSIAASVHPGLRARLAEDTVGV